MNTIILKVLLILFFSFLKITFLFLPKKIDQNKYSNLRVFIINKLCKIQNLILKKINYPLNLFRTKEQHLYAEVGGVLLDTSYTYRYFKITENFKFKNQGEGYEFFFKKTKKNNFFDLGSHIGEISLYFAKKYSNTKIVSVEGSPSCFKIQKRNIFINKVENIYPLNFILSNNNSEEFTSDNFGTENYTISKPKDGFVKVKVITLSKLLEDTNTEFIDFLKIDIEGSIPKLSKDLVNLWKNNKIHFCCLSIEKNSYESYENIINIFSENSNIYEIDPNNDLNKKIDQNYLKQTLRNELGDDYQSNRFGGTEVVFENKKFS